MLTNRTSRRAAALAAAVALGAPAAAPAALPKMQQADFVVSATATQTISWEREPMAGVADCTPIERITGRGTERLSLRLRPWRFTAYRTASELAFVAAPGRSGFGPEGPVRVTRTGAEQVEEVAGTCMGNPGRVTSRGPYDCGDRNRTGQLQLLWKRGRLAVGMGEGLLHPLGETEYETCPVHAHDAVRPNDLTEVAAALPLRDLLDPDLRQHIVLGRRTFKLKQGGYRGTTTVRWQVKLTRKGAIRG